MSGRARHPLKSLVMFLVVCGIAGLAWANRDRLRIGGEAETPKAELVTSITEKIHERFDRDDCFVNIRSPLLWRSNEGRFRLDIVVVEGCDRASKSLVADIARLIMSTSERPASVFAFDDSGRELARHIL